MDLAKVGGSNPVRADFFQAKSGDIRDIDWTRQHEDAVIKGRRKGFIFLFYKRLILVIS